MAILNVEREQEGDKPCALPEELLAGWNDPADPESDWLVGHTEVEELVKDVELGEDFTYGVYRLVEVRTVRKVLRVVGEGGELV